MDLTVPNADAVRDFYKEVVGWTSSGCDMGGYEDYVMSQPEGEIATSGICHARGPNVGLPPQWLMYINVSSLEASVEAVIRLGGKLIKRGGGPGAGGFFAIIQDPAGAVCALFEPYGEQKAAATSG